MTRVHVAGHSPMRLRRIVSANRKVQPQLNPEQLARAEGLKYTLASNPSWHRVQDGRKKQGEKYELSLEDYLHTAGDIANFILYGITE